MTREALRNGEVTQASVSEAMMLARGDLFIAAAFLGVTPREMNSYVRADPELQILCVAIGNVKVNPAYTQLSDEQFERAARERRAAYRVEALDTIAEMSRMEFDSAAMAEVKLKAAVAMLGKEEVHAEGSGQDAVLADLDRLYRESAPRVRQVRAKLLEITYGEPEIREVNQSTS